MRCGVISRQIATALFNRKGTVGIRRGKKQKGKRLYATNNEPESALLVEHNNETQVFKRKKASRLRYHLVAFGPAYGSSIPNTHRHQKAIFDLLKNCPLNPIFRFHLFAISILYIKASRITRAARSIKLLAHTAATQTSRVNATAGTLRKPQKTHFSGCVQIRKKPSPS